MKMQFTVTSNHFYIFFIMAVLFYLIYSFLINGGGGIEGQYIRVSGDINQPKYMDNIKNGRSNTYIYYDDHHKIIDNGSETSFLLKRLSTHTNSSSICTKLHSFDDHHSGSCSGYAIKKFNKNNIRYKSFHNYYRIGDVVYYENAYFFEDGDISFAIYKKYKDI